MDKKLMISIMMAVGLSNSAPLLMFPLESDLDSNILALWENSIKQIFKEAAFEPVKVDQNYFAQCENVECAISSARVAGAQGLFRGRLRAEGKDSISLRFHIDWLASNSTPQSDIQGTAPLSWDDAMRSGILSKLLSGITGKSTEVEIAKGEKTYVSVETNPENAVVMLNGEATCSSPCEFLASGSRAQIAAYWQSGDNIWAAKTDVKLGKDTTKVLLELRRTYSYTEIRTLPESALIYPGGFLDLNSKALGKTPYRFHSLPGNTQIRLFREGYKDTLIDVNVDALEKQVQIVQLNPMTDARQIADQNLFIKSQTKRKIGLGLLGGSVGPFTAGTLLCILARDDYQKAREIKSELSHPSVGGENFKAKVKENHNAVERGDKKIIFGSSLIGISLILAGVGFSMSF
ncbi:MAG: PEGA domain-containing protein [Fibromonadales bacterium]|nr:PEGA domain-containing protein [Fibromonadales bacterium]